MKAFEELQRGDVVWLECEVKPGPFSDERMIRIGGGTLPPEHQWLGFVPADRLEDPTATSGKTRVQAKVLEVEDNSVSFRVPGHSITSSVFHSSKGQVGIGGSVQV